MPNVERIHGKRQGRRPHYLREWMDRCHMKPKDITDATGADKGLISRWLNPHQPATPNQHYQQALREALHIDADDGIFRHPDDDWMSRLLQDRPDEERERIRALIEATVKAAFPRRTG
jgi:transcriptional regulator with XRE-family HTH domain